MSTTARPYFARLVAFIPAAVTSALALLAQDANAATQDGLFAARGIGAQPCSVLVQAVEGTDGAAVRDRLSIWISGYLSHTNRAGADTFDAMPIQDHTALASIVANICRSNPTALTETVFFSLVTQISNGKSDVMSDMLSVKAGEAETFVRSDVLKQVQLALVELKLLDSSNADGLPGPNTRTALESFQASAGLTVTGLPDPATLFILFTKE